VPALLASAQAFALASDHEGFPLSVLEAMRAGLPVVASDLPGIREQLDDGACGLLVAGHDEQAWAAALTRLAGDASRRETLGRAARTRWAREFGLGPMAEATWTIYRQALAGRPGGARAAADTGASGQ